MTKTTRIVRQRCDVCDGEARYFRESVVVLGKTPERGLITQQCGKCRRLLCSQHAARAVCLLEPAVREQWSPTIKQTGFVPTVLCCPFDGQLLAQLRDAYTVLLNRDDCAGVIAQRYAQQYLQMPEQYVLSLAGHDLSSSSMRDVVAWPLEPSPSSELLERLRTAQATFEERRRAGAERQA